MSKPGWRDPNGHYAKKRSPGYIIGIWLASFGSIGLLLLTGYFVRSDFSAFKSCNANSAGLSLTSCGKSALNIGDFALIGLFVLSALLTVSLFTGAIRTVRRRA